MVLLVSVSVCVRLEEKTLRFSPRPTTCNRPSWLDWPASRPFVGNIPCVRNDFLPPPVTDGRVARGTSARLCVHARASSRPSVRVLRSWSRGVRYLVCVVIVQWPKIGSRYVGGGLTVHWRTRRHGWASVYTRHCACVITHHRSFLVCAFSFVFFTLLSSSPAHHLRHISARVVTHIRVPASRSRFFRDHMPLLIDSLNSDIFASFFFLFFFFYHPFTFGRQDRVSYRTTSVASL